MDQPAARNRLRQRKAIVEPVFSHFRLRQNFNRFRRKGLLGVRVEFSLQAMAYNISRVIALNLIFFKFILQYDRLINKFCFALKK